MSKKSSDLISTAKEAWNDVELMKLIAESRLKNVREHTELSASYVATFKTVYLVDA